MKIKKFDCVDMKRKSQNLIYNEIKKMTQEEELAFWQKGTNNLRQLQNTSRVVTADKKSS